LEIKSLLEDLLEESKK